MIRPKINPIDSKASTCYNFSHTIKKLRTFFNAGEKACQHPKQAQTQIIALMKV
jgi:hypothetical protein